MQAKKWREETVRGSAGNGGKLSGDWLSRLSGVHSKGPGYRRWFLTSGNHTKITC